jgi:hypothetical protein
VSDVYSSGGQPPWGPRPPQWGPPAPQWGPPPAQWGAPPQFGPPPPGSGGLSGLAWAAIAVAVVMAIGLATVVAVGVVHAVRNGPAVNAASCQEPIPAGASPAATAFLNDLNTGYVGCTAVSRSLRDEHYEVHLDDLVTEQTTDEAFLSTLERIKFTGAAKGTGVAAEYISVVDQYVQALATAINQYGYYASDHQQFLSLDVSRSALAAELRADLDLPAAKCTVLRP